MKYSEICNAAADLIEEGWTQLAFARTAEGVACQPNAEAAVSWCLNGALRAVCRNLFYPTITLFLEGRFGLGTADYQSRWNDDPFRTKEEVITRLRNAAKQAGEEEKTYG